MNSLTLNSSSISNAWREGGAMQRNAGTIGNNYLLIFYREIMEILLDQTVV